MAQVEATEFFGTKYLPLREALDQLGGNVDWDDSQKQATVSVGGRSAVLTMANQTVLAGSQPIVLSAPPLVQGGILYVPQDFFPLVLGQTVYVA